MPERNLTLPPPMSMAASNGRRPQLPPSKVTGDSGGLGSPDAAGVVRCGIHLVVRKKSWVQFFRFYKQCSVAFMSWERRKLFPSVVVASLSSAGWTQEVMFYFLEWYNCDSFATAVLVPPTMPLATRETGIIRVLFGATHLECAVYEGHT